MNGIYDILCATCILYFPENILASLHTHMFFHTDALHKRLLAYWILMYGIIRTFSREKSMICTTYVLESVAYMQEFHIFDSVYAENSIFVYILCMWLAYFIYRYN